MASQSALQSASQSARIISSAHLAGQSRVVILIIVESVPAIHKSDDVTQRNGKQSDRVGIGAAAKDSPSAPQGQSVVQHWLLSSSFL